tara:strand:- start:905 stop:1327 length:423 start_codon:yes stop_codon:yes gene_type:complete
MNKPQSQNANNDSLLKQFKKYKRELIKEVRNQSKWHKKKFKQRRQEGIIDTRLEIGAEVLARVADELEILPPDYPQLREAWRRWYGLTQNKEQSEHELLLRTILLQEFYINYGFNWEDANSEKFLNSYLDALTTAGEIAP